MLLVATIANNKYNTFFISMQVFFKSGFVQASEFVLK
jgi:hypothetical protein